MKIDEINDIKSELMTLDDKYFPILRVFVNFLKTNPDITKKKKGKPIDALGAFEGDLIYMSPDFDEPMELVDSKKLRELESLEKSIREIA